MFLLMKNYLRRKTILICLGGLFCTGIMEVYADVSSTADLLEVQQQDNKNVNGVIVDENGEPIAGANIVIKGTTTGTVSNIDGMFNLSVPQKGATLLITFIGYENSMVEVSEKTQLRIVMVPVAEQLNEVVVTALGIKREKKALGYAMQEVKTDALTENKSVSIANMLQGKIAGVQIAQSGTGLGGSTRIIMRGLNSLSGNNQPLWVVDGIPINDGSQEAANEYGGVDRYGAASQINPEDIESISVLKGANAAALYGSRAQNGAIIVTTKKGKQGQPLEIEYNGNLEFNSIYDTYDYQNVYGQGSGGNFSTSARGSWGPKMEGQLVPNWRNVIYGDKNYSDYALLPQPDYINEFYETGVQYSNSLIASAGNDHLTGRFSFTDSRNDGITPNHSINRQYYDLNTEFKNKHLTIGVKVNFMREEVNNAPGQGEYGLMNQLVNIPRGIRLSDLSSDILNADNKIINWSGPAENYSNPYGLIMDGNGNSNLRNRLLGQIRASLRITDYLNLTGRVGLDWYNDKRKTFGLYLSDGSNATSQYAHVQSSNQEFNADLILNFNKTFNQFSVTANLGTSVYNTTYEGLVGDAGSFQIPNFVYMSNGDRRLASESYSKKEIQSVFGNVNVGYKSMIYLDVTGRNDWSSTLPSSNWSYFYPSVSLSGIVSEMVKLPSVIDYLKIRASWAKVGNDTNPYRLDYVYSSFSSMVNGGSVLEMKLPDTYPLRDLKPEETNSYEVGFDFRMFKNRFGVDFTYYFIYY